MATTNFNIRLDENLKLQANTIVEQYGLTLTQVFKMLLTQIVKTEEIPLSLSYASKKNQLTYDEPNATTLRAIHDALDGKLDKITPQDGKNLAELLNEQIR